MTEAPEKRLPVLMLFVGLALFVTGVIVAKLRLPEWRAKQIPPASFFAQRFREAADRAGLLIEKDPPLQLTSTTYAEEDSQLNQFDPAYRHLGTAAPDWLTAKGRGPFVSAEAESRWPTGGQAGQLRVKFSIRGEPLSVSWVPNNPLGRTDDVARQQRALASIFLPGSAFSPGQEVEVLGTRLELLPLAPGPPPESLVLATAPGSSVVLVRRTVGSTSDLRQQLLKFDITQILVPNLPGILVNTILFLGTAALFVVLLVKRRIDFTNGVILGGLSLAVTIFQPFVHFSNWLHYAEEIIDVLGKAIAVFVLWSATESWIRSTAPGFRTSLDTLRAGRIGPQGGRALLGGWGGGAAAAGLWLIALTLSTFIPGVSPLDGSIHLPVFGPGFSPIDEGALRAGLVLLAVAGAAQLPVLRSIRLLGLVAATLFLAVRLELSAFWVAVPIALAIAGVLVFTDRRFGLSALLTASIISLALPATIYAARHLSWLGAAFVGTAAISAAPLVFGLIGLRRPDEVETGHVSVPAFVRRLEEERRLRYEMELLARMQLGLLPRQTPRIGGYEVAARSVLATEAGGDLYDFLTDERGGLWIAAGDVSGHGYSCAIAQAMTKAGLASLIGPDQTPAAVLGRLDRVLRNSGSSRTFTSLALLRLDPESGEALMANAGHPYPLLVSDGDVREIAIPSLPLGQGPARSYENYPIRLVSGSVLVFCSDGLFEAVDGHGSAYGFERLRGVLAGSKHRSAEDILQRILDDWRRHMGRSAPADDTTIVVLKRA